MATNIKLLDENALSAIKTYVDTKVGEAGKVDDVKINSTSVVTSKVANIAVDGTYNSSSNKIATQTTVSNAIGALDVSNISGFGAGKTLATLTETDGKIAATFQDIQLASTAKVTGLDTALAGKVPTSRTIAGLALTSNITSASLITALGLQQAMTYIGVATTTKPSAGHYVQTVIGGTTYYVSMDSDGAAQQENAVKGQILTIGSKEYICTTAGASGTNVFSEMGDESSYALKTITISSGSGLSGGGDLTTNRTISHAVPTGAATKSSGFYKFSTDGFGHVNGTTAVAKADLTGLGVADNSAVIHTTGAETAAGVKTFSDGISISDGKSIAFGGSYASLNKMELGLMSNTTPTVTAYVRANPNATGHEAELALSNSSGTTYYQVGKILHKVNSTTYTYTMPTKSGTFAMTSDIPSVSDFVTMSTAQTISGKKTFSHADGIAISNAGATATLSVTNNSEDGELNIGGVDYLYLPYVTFGQVIGVSGIWGNGNNNTISLGGSEEGILTLTNGCAAASGYSYNVIYKTNWNNGSTTAISTYGVQFPDTHGYTANRTLATTADIPSVSGFVTGPSSNTANALALFDGTTGKVLKNSGVYYRGSNPSSGSVFEIQGGTANFHYVGNGSRPAIYVEGGASGDLGTSSRKWNDLYLSGNLTDGTNSTTISTIKSHLDNTTVHITSAERTAWNAKISAVKSLKTDATATQSTSSSEALSGSGTVTLHRISKTGKLSHLLSDDGGSVSVITTAEINAILYPSA